MSLNIDKNKYISIFQNQCSQTKKLHWLPNVNLVTFAADNTIDSTKNKVKYHYYNPTADSQLLNNMGKNQLEMQRQNQEKMFEEMKKHKESEVKNDKSTDVSDINKSG